MEERYEDVPYEEGYNVADARVVKRASGAPLAVCGGLRRFAQMEAIVTEGTAEIVSLSRPFLRQPDLVTALLNEGADADCIHCGLCQNAGRGVNCLFPKV
jgi:2,4-dienoyl-CoA reductase-like NADH-dependent reductase (Old Yellow Enzyme family)